MTALLPDLPRLPPEYDCRGGDPSLEPAELLAIIRDAIANHPRSLQAELGPSEIGSPCTRRLGYKLLDIAETNPRRDAWKPTVGTAVHTWLEGVLQAHNDAHKVDRFYLEERVDVGELQGQPITGKCDVYDRFTATVVDWKIVGLAALKRYRKDGPGTQYRAQAHLYGRGYRRAGLPVDRVAVFFLPQNDELSSAHYWSEPYDEALALEALAKVNGAAQVVAQLQERALPLLPTADAYCTYCPFFLPAITDLREGCPGHPHSSAGDLPAVTAAPAA